MDLINGIINVFSPLNLLYCFIGLCLGDLGRRFTWFRPSLNFVDLVAHNYVLESNRIDHHVSRACIMERSMEGPQRVS